MEAAVTAIPQRLRLISEFPKFSLPPDPNQYYTLAVPSHRGALRTSRTRGGMRWTRSVRLTKRAAADGEVVWF